MQELEHPASQGHQKILPPLQVWTRGLRAPPCLQWVQDLHGRYLVVDKGLRLGTNKTAFPAVLSQGRVRTTRYHSTGPGRDQAVDQGHYLEDERRRYNPLPDMVVNDARHQSFPNLQALYNRMEKELFIQLDSGKEVRCSTRRR